MSWNQWPQATPPPVVAATAPLLNPAPSVLPPGMPYSTDQWTQMQQQNWQQWAQWQQQYQQWHQQYGAEYQKSISALAAQQTVAPAIGLPPPLPLETQAAPPPLPQDELPQPAPPLPTSQLPMPQYSTQPLNNKFSTPPPNFANMPPRININNDQKRPLTQPDDSIAKRQMINKQQPQQQQQQGGWKTMGSVPNIQSGNMDELSEAEKKFDKQFAEWEAQFNKWKDQNSGHPDKEQYREYEKKWEKWRQQLLERREAMRKKRLALSATSNKILPNQNFNVPPPTQNSTAAQQLLQQKQGLLPLPTIPPKDALLPTPTLFTKPPPDMNNEPLQFKKNETETVQTEESVGFLNTTRSEGIPGLDLVREGEEINEEICDEVVPQKGPDLEAISKGINNILGDQKLMSMLSMVTQNQNISQNTNINNFPKTNTSFPEQEQSLYSRIEPAQIIDDQTRSSFTMQDSDFYRGGAVNNQMNRGPFENDLPFNRGQLNDRFDSNRSFEDDYQKPPMNRQGNRMDSFDQKPPPLMGKNFDKMRENFGPRGLMGKRPPQNMENFDRDNFVQADKGHFGMQENFTNDRFNQGTNNRNEFDRNNSFDRDQFGSRFNREEFGQTQMGNYRSNNTGPDRDRFRGDFGKPNVPMGNMNNVDNMNRNRGPFNKDNMDMGRGRYSDDGFNSKRGVVDSNDRRNFMQNDYNYMEDNFDDDQDFGNDDYMMNSERCWNDGGNNEPSSKELNVRPKFRTSEKSNNRFTTSPLNNNNRGQDIGHFENRNSFNKPNIGDVNFGRNNSRDDDYYPPPPSLLDLPMQLAPPLIDAPEPPQFNSEDCSNNDSKPEISPKEAPLEDIWKPTTLIDYDHKSLQQQVEVDILVEPFRMFDYRHKQLRRIPFPERPNWLSDAVRMIPEFDPPLIRTSLMNERRMYKDRYENDRYDPKERLRYDRNAGFRFSPPTLLKGETRKRSYEDDWRNRPKSPTKFDRFLDANRGRKEWNVHEATSKNWDEEEDWRGEKEGRGRTSGDIMDVDDRDRNRERNRNFERDSFNKRSIFPLNEPPEEKKSKNVTLIEDIINAPGRFNRPPRLVIILRGPPGSGKTHLAKLIKDKEVENGGSAPRILSLDDYFMVEQEKEVIEDGRKTKIKEMVYEFEAEMEESYRISLMKSFKKTITDGYFPFIIVDNVNDKVRYFGEMWSFAKQNGFQVFICELDLDVQNCTRRNIHNRTEEEIRKCVQGWENTPPHHPILDASLLTQEELISEVEMEEINSPGSIVDDNGDGLEIKPSQDRLDRSKWDNFDCSINNLARLDGVNKPLRPSRTMEEYLQLDDWEPSKPTKPGQKRVRWADLEERKKQEKMRAIGFVVGQTNWDRMMDPTMGESALTQTKYIEKVGRSRF